jgi:hypothetical protein
VEPGKTLALRYRQIELAGVGSWTVLVESGKGEGDSIACPAYCQVLTEGAEDRTLVLGTISIIMNQRLR